MPLFMAGAVLLVVLLVVRATRPRVVIPGTLPPMSQWHVQFPPGGAIGLVLGPELAGYGRFVMDPYALHYFPADEEQPTWALAYNQITVRSLSMWTPGGARIELCWPQGRLRFRVSREKLNRFVNNGFKDLRELTYNSQFLAEIVARGARQVIDTPQAPT